MLSRVAERLYWLGRYMERAENTARLINAYSYLLMDLPRAAQVGWNTVIAISGNNEQFNAQYEQADELNVTRFMLSQKNNPSSLISSLSSARENARTSREIIPAEAWELINDLYHFAKDDAAKSVVRAGRHHFLPRIINASQQLNGLLSGCMSHNHAYEFIIIGCNIERADMSSRIIDVGAGALYYENTDNAVPYEDTLWMNVLRSLSAYQMYRQHMQNRITGKDVATFLLKDEDFPRAILHCLNRLAGAVQKLPNHETCLHAIATTRQAVRDADPRLILAQGGLYDYIDRLQLDFAGIHYALTSTWFLHSDPNETAA